MRQKYNNIFTPPYFNKNLTLKIFKSLIIMSLIIIYSYC